MLIKPVSLQADRTTAHKPHSIHGVDTPWTDHTAHRPCLMFLQYCAERLARRSVSKMTYFVS